MDDPRTRIPLKRPKFGGTESMYYLENISLHTEFKHYGNFDCFAFEVETVTFEETIVSRCCVLEISQWLLNETYYMMLRPSSEGLNIHYMVCDSFFLSFKTRDTFKELRKIKLTLVTSIKIMNLSQMSKKI